MRWIQLKSEGFLRFGFLKRIKKFWTRLVKLKVILLWSIDQSSGQVLDGPTLCDDIVCANMIFFISALKTVPRSCYHLFGFFCLVNSLWFLLLLFLSNILTKRRDFLMWPDHDHHSGNDRSIVLGKRFTLPLKERSMPLIPNENRTNVDFHCTLFYSHHHAFVMLCLLTIVGLVSSKQKTWVWDIWWPHI